MVHRFAVDKMLGRLATWLRIVGQDATYGAHLSGQTLVRHARAEGRTILTRNLRLRRLRRHHDASLRGRLRVPKIALAHAPVELDGLLLDAVAEGRGFRASGPPGRWEECAS
jgi:hypothetical protein